MSKVAQKTKEEGKGAIISSMIVEQEQKTMEQEQETRIEYKGLNAAAIAFVSLYLSRLDAGKGFSNAAQTLREIKSRETFAFWQNNAEPFTGFGGKSLWKAPAFDGKILDDCLKRLGWSHKQRPAGYATFAKKHGLKLTAFEKACYDQEQAAYAAAKKNQAIERLPFSDDTLTDILSFISEKDKRTLPKVINSLTVALTEKLAADS